MAQTTAAAGHDWMRVALAVLFDDHSLDDARRFLHDPGARSALRAEVDRRLAGAGRAQRVPPGDRGDNLLQAILALRVKFPRDEATAKLELNIALRER